MDNLDTYTIYLLQCIQAMYVRSLSLLAAMERFKKSMGMTSRSNSHVVVLDYVRRVGSAWPHNSSWSLHIGNIEHTR